MVVAVGPGEHPLLEIGLLEELGELLVVDDRARRLALEHVDQLRTGEGGVEVEDVGAELGGRDGRVDEAAVVAAHHRDRVALTDAEPGQTARERVAAPVELAEGQLTELVDDRRAVGVGEREGGEAACGPGAPLLEDAGEPGELARPERTDDTGTAEDLEGDGHVRQGVRELVHGVLSNG